MIIPCLLILVHILGMMHLLLFILATWLHYALAGLPTNNPEFACPDLVAWTEVDPSAEDQVYFEEQADQP